MAKEPMRLTQELKDNVRGYGTALGMGLGISMANTVPGMVIGTLGGAALGAGIGVAKTAYDAVKANRHSALGRQFRD